MRKHSLLERSIVSAWAGFTVILLLWVCTAIVRAQPPKNAPTPSKQSETARRGAIRGCPLGQETNCRRNRATLLREFELRAFQPSGSQSPWVERNSRQTDAPPPPVSRTNPTKLRPDLPWLAELRLPDLPVHWDFRIIRYLEFYKNDPKGRNIMHAWLRDQGKYRDLILAHLRNAGLPDDLLYVAMIESSYSPRENSRSGASGLWQFMPSGGRIYGLRMNHWLDERKDPVRSTEAAMLYFADLYHRFGNWDLALAAYNAGYSAVLRSISKYNTNNFWTLLEHENALPWESSIYVPKALAAAIVGNNRKLFGFDKIEEKNRLRWDNVTVSKSVSIAVIARAAGVSAKAISRLNPQLRRNRTPPGIKNYPVRIPYGHAKQFNSKIHALQALDDDYVAYAVPHGQRFEDIATIHGLTRQALLRLNSFAHESEVGGGMYILVPRLTSQQKQRNGEKAQQSLYTAGVPEGQIGDKLLVAVTQKNRHIRGRNRVFYRVVTGDSLVSVANALSVSRSDLASWNHLHHNARLHPRMVLQAFLPPKRKPSNVALLDPSRLRIVTRGSKEHLELAEKRTGRKRVVYRANGRESLSDIGKRFGLSARDLARINRLPPTTVLNPSDKIIAYKVVDPSRSKRAQQQARKIARTRTSKSKTGKRRSKPQVRNNP